MMKNESARMLRALSRKNAAGISGREQLRMRAVLAVVHDGKTMREAADLTGLTVSTVGRWIRTYRERGFDWTELLDSVPPRNGDFLANYERGLWGEEMAVKTLNGAVDGARVVPYGTSRGDMFKDAESFHDYFVAEKRLRAWSGERLWKRPDLLAVRGEKTPDLRRLDNDACDRFVATAMAAFEVEVSLWDSRRKPDLSFAIKEEDLPGLRSWVSDTGVPLYIVQFLYDCAYILPFSRLTRIIASGTIAVSRSPKTGKNTYMVPLEKGEPLCTLSEPGVAEGKQFVNPNGQVFLFATLKRSRVEPVTETVRNAVLGEL